MEYSIQEFAQLAGVTTRTLRYYDRIGLLEPARVSEAGYRIYTSREADALQQILFYKSFGMELRDIKQALQVPDFDRLEALQNQLEQLRQKRRQLDGLIDNITRTILCEKGEAAMSDGQKFEAFKKQLVEENEQEYGDEIRQKYGDDTVEQSNARMMNLTQQQYDDMQQLATEMLTLLEQAVETGQSPQSEQGADIARLHKEWLGYSWPDYSAEAHRNLADMYIADERFTVYYDGNVPGCAQFLRDAIHVHMQ